MAELSAATQCWLRCKEVFGGHRVSWRAARAASAPAEDAPAEQRPFGPNRDPHTSGDALTQLFAQFAWAEPVAQAQLIDRWPALVGERIAAHARPLYADDGVLLVQCDSTAWATQLRAMRGELLQRIHLDLPDAAITELRFLNPGAPSWRHGNRSVPGRGPRDTYG